MKPTPKAIGAHWLAFLIPFIGGLYLADYRVFTETTLRFLYFFSAFVFLLLTVTFLSKPAVWLRAYLLPFCFFSLGFWQQFLEQQAFREAREIQPKNRVIGLLEIEEVQEKPNGQLLFGSFQFQWHGKSIALPIQVYTNWQQPLFAQEKLWINCQPEVVQNETYPGAFDLERFLQLKGITHVAYVDSSDVARRFSRPEKTNWQQLLTEQRAAFTQLFERYLDGEATDIAIALIIGDRSGVDATSKMAFQGTGSMHIMAVSGMHIALLINVLLQVCAYLGSWIPRRSVIIFLLILIWYYAFLTGLSAAVLRSVVMFTFLLLGQLSGKQVSSLLLLYFSAFLLLLFDPLLLFDLGFQLSYMAMWGIFLLYPKISAYLHFRWSYLQTLWEGTALGLAATLSTAPLSLYYFHSFPNYFAIANLFLMSLSSFILVLGMLFPLVALLPQLNIIFGWILEKSIELLLLIMDYFAKLPGALVQGFSFSFLWVFGVWLLLYYWQRGLNLSQQRLAAVFSVFFLAELSFGRISNYQTQAIFNLKQQQTVAIKAQGGLQFFASRPSKRSAILRQGFETYYGVPSQMKILNKNFIFVKILNP
jgi:ComEC/Rec2-related protein